VTASAPPSRGLLAISFLKAARSYWLSVFPCICAESRYWRARAETIPDPVLRRLALEAQRVKQGNIEGSAAFAAFAPPAHRHQAVRAQVAFQSVYDYVDTLTEQPNSEPILNASELHQALPEAISANTGHPDYYARYPRRGDGGYLREIVDVCRRALGTLPSRAAITEPAHRLVERIVDYQCRNLSEPQGGHHHLEQWARLHTPRETDLRWWETAASAGSSLGLFALIASAAQPALPTADAVAIEAAYWPWIGALHSLLDSLIDQPEDAAVGQRSLLDYYATPEETADRLQLLAHEALSAVRSLPNAHEHTLVLAGMASYYLTAPEASTPTAQLVARGVLRTLGPTTRPSIVVMRARRTASRIRLA
jgi:tetraprenyl-beta-curcumene synthase